MLLETINNVLDFSKLSTGKFVLEASISTRATMIRTAVDLLAGAARKKNLKLVLFIDDQVPAVLRGDPARLRQVLINLLNNAVKFTELGEVVVRVTVANEPKQRGLRLEVADTGIGIPQETQSRLFQPFYQADSSTTRRISVAADLALRSRAQLVELMGGGIGVISQPGEGSTFWFTVALEQSRDGRDGAGAGP